MKTIIIAAFLLCLTGCGGGMAVEKSQGIKDDLAYVAAGWKAANLTGTDLCGREVLSQDVCEKAEGLSRQVQVAIFLAHSALKDGDTPAAQNQLVIALKALTALQAIVAAGDKKSEITVEGVLT